MKKVFSLILSAVGLVPNVALAHCPLCTAGAGVLAVAAAYLGVSTIVVGVLVGAFALALGFWLAPFIKREYVPYQKYLITAVIFFSTVIPVMPLIREYGPFYLSLGGEYGTLFHNTYTIDLYLFGVILGALVTLVAPYVSTLVTRVRGVQFPFQGMGLTLGLLVIISLVIQVWPR